MINILANSKGERERDREASKIRKIGKKEAISTVLHSKTY